MSPSVIGLCAETAWWVALGVIVLITIPRRPQAAHPNNNLSPGMQVMLAHRARATWVAPGVDATFADLVRRGWIDASAQEVRIGKGDRKPLDQAEKVVFKHVKAVVARSPQGTAPLAALREGPGAQDGWREFRGLYEVDARHRGLVKDRISKKATIIMVLAGGVTSGWLVYCLTGQENVGVLIGAFLITGLLHGMPLMPMDYLVLTQSGANKAGPMQTVPGGPGLGKYRAKGSGWTHSETTGWRQWQGDGCSF